MRSRWRAHWRSRSASAGVSSRFGSASAGGVWSAWRAARFGLPPRGPSGRRGAAGRSGWQADQKYVVRYNLKPDAGGVTRAVAWEATGQGGLRYVALSVGYVEEYDAETLRQYQK